MPGSNEIVVGVLYPRVWFGDEQRFVRELDAIAAVDPRIRVIAEEYVEPHELRSARGKPGADALRDQAPVLTDAQREAFGQLGVALAIDLPFDVATVAPRLGWVQAVGAGTGQLQSAGLGPAGVRLTTAAGANAVGIAEFAIGRVLQDLKQFRALDDAQNRQQWDPVYGQQLGGRTLGLIGLGAINQAVADRAKPFGLEILAVRRSATPGATAPNVDEVHPPDALHDVVARCDIVIAAVPETDETRGLMDTKAFAAMPRGSFFCNVGRGSLVDEDALLDALQSGHLRAAALDVTSVEPLPADHPLWDAPNLYLSPHSATSPQALFANLHELFRDNLARFVAGEPLRNEVDLARGY